MAEAAAAKVGAQADNGAVLVNLLLHSLGIAVLPIAGYFGSLNYIWKGNTIFAALTAVVVANVVFVSFIMQAYKEHKAEQAALQSTASEKKSQ
ncbi:hypothetical protein BKA62DRAFT_826657 [Auriculariales sp. MPI-PUGE-AT-0066]|nr:hypothetical protein BKA62DRAFT_826657 [Auriculariales sp. MPI-PUGE-AT-0066]